MRQVLGEMYDKYETFNIYLYQINQSSAFSSLPPAIAINLAVDVRMKDLQFLNSTYSARSGNNTPFAFVTSYVLNNVASDGLGTVTPMFNATILTFSKTAECVDLTIDMKRSTRPAQYPGIVAPVNQGPPNSFGTFIFLFKLRGDQTREKNIIKNGSRMIIN